MENIAAAHPCALFDFDGTLTKSSTIFPFFLAVCGWREIAKNAHKLAWPTLMYFIKRRTFSQMMRLATEMLLSGRKVEELEAAAKIVLDQLEDGMWGQTLACFHYHHNSGHRVAIVTGGYGYVAQAWLSAHGYKAEVFASEIEFGLSGVSSTKMICVEQEKLAAISWGASPRSRVYAYGNSRGDMEMLEASDFPFWVDKQGVVSPYKAASN